jgi:hypothetical protein
MPLFHPRIIEKHISEASPLPSSHYRILKTWEENLNKGIYNSETQNDGEFIQRILIDVLGYRGSSSGGTWTIAKNQPVGRGNVDVALGNFSSEVVKVLAPFELKGAKTKDLDAIMPGRNKSPVQQAWEYANDSKGAKWVLVSNYRHIRLYAYGYGRNDFEEFDLSKLHEQRNYAKFMLLLSPEQLLGEKTLSLLKESEDKDKEITNLLYSEYKNLRLKLIEELTEDKHGIQPIKAVQHAQTILDRILFIAFSEDKGLLPKNTLKNAYESSNPFNPQPIWSNFVGLFNAIDIGNSALNIPGYNGGLFEKRSDLDTITISDETCEGFRGLGEYDFDSDVSVNILGHIFEQSISDIEGIKQDLQGESALDISKNAKRKKDGIFYTPSYITRHIVERSVGGWLKNEKTKIGFNELPELDESDYESIRIVLRGKNKNKTTFNKKIRLHVEAWEKYKEVLSNIKVLDPACGSGAFLNEVFDYLYKEGQLVNNELTVLNGGQAHLFRWDKHILANNIYGVDLNPESIEITKLSLWLKTASRDERLTYLDDNIKCGNSLIDDPQVAGAAFLWESEFKAIMDSGGFDIVVGNPPYGAKLSDKELLYLTRFQSHEYQVNTYVLFFEKGLALLRNSGILGFITPSTFTYQHYYKKIRKIISAYEIMFLSKYTFPVFEDADTGDTVALIIRKTARRSQTTHLQVFRKKEDVNSSYREISYDDLIKKDGVFNFTGSSILDKVFKKTKPLGDLAQIVVGVKPYQTGKGIPKQTKEVVQKKPFTKTHKQNDSYINCIVGSDFHRYGFIRDPNMWLKYGEWLAEPREGAPFFDAQKIIVRQTADSIIAHLDDTRAVNLNNVYNIGRVAKGVDIKYLLCLLNSTLIKLVYRFIAQEKGKVFAEVKKTYLQKIPVAIASPEVQTVFISKANSILRERRELKEISSNFMEILSTEFPKVKITKNISKWYKLEFEEFVNELKKNKITLTLKEKADWLVFFKEERMKARRRSQSIDYTDSQIDQLVNDLYGITHEEISLMLEDS